MIGTSYEKFIKKAQNHLHKKKMADDDNDQKKRIVTLEASERILTD